MTATDRLFALAEAWDALAADMDRVAAAWRGNGNHEQALISRGRARQLTACATELRNVLAEPEEPGSP